MPSQHTASATSRIIGNSTGLRRATLDDVPALRELTHAAYASSLHSANRTPELTTTNFDKVVVAHIVDVLEVDQQLLAMIDLVPCEKRLSIENIVVRPDHQRRGIGTILLLHAEEVAMRMGFSEIQLYTNGAFVEKIAFYSRIGFEQFRKESLKSGGSIVYMRKHLISHKAV